MNQPWEITERKGVCWAGDPAWNAGGQVFQGFCGRSGGVSQGDYASLNIGFSGGDDVQRVEANRRIMANAMGFDLDSWTGVWQIHGNRVLRVCAEDAGRGAFRAKEGLVQADGQITDVPGITLISQHADCVPLYFWDPKRRAIGLSHAGWKGTLLDIAGCTVRAMAEAFGSKPEELFAAIGPSAGPCHYEVDEPVIRKAAEIFGEEIEGLTPVLLPSRKPGHAYLDLWQANRQLMLRRGILDQRISMSGLCTICHQDLFFSHRCGARGRQAAVLRLL